MEELSPQVKALNNDQLEQVSGGMELTDAMQTIAMFLPQCQALGAQLGAALSPLLDEIAFEKKYGKAMTVLDSYNNSELDIEVRASKYAASWNSKHPNDFMPDEVALAILSIENPCTQAVVACAGSVTKIVNTYNGVMNANSAS
ncbi:MAG: hypothetical protein IKE05_04205 [Clostridia bacterium]|nr:hypothetical protein [Clostridia bacterium]